MALACVAFWGHSRFDDVIQFAQNLGMKRSEWLDLNLDAMDKATGPIRTYIDDFLAETVEELHVTADDCVDFYSKEENFERLKRGEIGTNVLFNGRSKAMFHLWPAISEFAMETARKFIIGLPEASNLPDFEEFWANLTQFLTLRYVHGTTSQEMLAAVEGKFTYDVDAWFAAGMPKHFLPFKLSRPARVRFELPPESRQQLAAALHVYTDHLSGLSKMISRIHSGCMTRRSLIRRWCI
jgi:hypothetical protein